MKMAECFQKGLLKRTTPDMENALRSLELSKSNIEDAIENMSIHRYRVVAIRVIHPCSMQQEQSSLGMG